MSKMRKRIGWSLIAGGAALSCFGAGVLTARHVMMKGMQWDLSTNLKQQGSQS